MALDGNLNSRLKEQISRESETIQTATQQQLDAMRSELSSIYSDALTTIEADMRQESLSMAKRFRRLMLWPSLALVMISIAISGAAWAWTQYQYQQIEQQRQTLANLEALGVDPVRTEQGREYLLLPEGATISELKQTREGQPFVELRR